MRRKRQEIEPEESGSSEVQTIYGDVVTFIMSLFILLFVISHNDMTDKTFLSEMRIELGGKIIEQKDRVNTEALFISQVQGYIQKEKLESVTKILVDEQKIKIILEDPVLFPSGKADLSPRGIEILSGFAVLFKQTENPIIIEGHTDNIPISNDEFASNWELSFYRAFSVVKYMIAKYQFSPDQLSCLGYGEYRPIAPNDTRENRSLNRRIEMNVIRLSKADVAKNEESRMLDVSPTANITL